MFYLRANNCGGKSTKSKGKAIVKKIKALKAGDLNSVMRFLQSSRQQELDSVH